MFTRVYIYLRPQASSHRCEQKTKHVLRDAKYRLLNKHGSRDYTVTEFSRWLQRKNWNESQIANNSPAMSQRICLVYFFIYSFILHCFNYTASLRDFSLMCVSMCEREKLCKGCMLISSILHPKMKVWLSFIHP